MARSARREREALTRLDPRAPLVIDTRELPRRPGSMRRVTRTVPAPTDLTVGLIGVLEGTDLELDLRLESVVEGVLVSGTARARLAGECARCLEPLASSVEADIQELFAYPGREAPEADEEVRELDGDLLDLEQVVRDAVVLALPLSPVCRDDCPGLCAECGAKLAEVGEAHGHRVADPRWAALQQMNEQDMNEQDTNEQHQTDPSTTQDQES